MDSQIIILYGGPLDGQERRVHEALPSMAFRRRFAVTEPVADEFLIYTQSRLNSAVYFFDRISAHNGPQADKP